MNIIVKLFSSRFCFRPDTTWDRENRDFYVPEFVKELWYAPVVFVRISRAGKCVGRKFASRYYDGANYGMLMYDGGILAEGTPDSIAFASMLDHTSILPFPLYQPTVTFNPANTFEIVRDTDMLFTTDNMENADAENLKNSLEEALCKASEIISLRTGDILAVEISNPCTLTETRKPSQIDGRFADRNLFGFNVKF